MPGSIPYAELHCRSHFSFLGGASSPGELIARAIELGLPALAITDRNGLYGVVEAREALLHSSDLSRREDEGRARLKLLYGSELHVGDDVVTAVVERRDGYAHLSSLITRGRLAAPKGEFRLELGALCEHARGLFVLAGGPRSAPMRLLCAGERRQAAARLHILREAFGDHLFVELVRHGAPGDRERSLAMAELARSLHIPIVATGDVHFHAPERKPLADLLRCVDGGFPLAEAGRRLLPNAEACLRAPAAMQRRFSDLPDAVEHAAAIAGAVDFRLCDVVYSYPPPSLPPGVSADEHLARLCREGLARRLGARAGEYTARLQTELSLIAELRYAGYFLTMRDVVVECARRGILCQGRGSAANSLVCFSLAITSVHPDTIDMLFERFISRERNEPPDIDLDIEHERREEIIQYMYGTFGRDHAGMVAEVIRYQRRSALRDFGKALGFSERELARMSTFLSHRWSELDADAFRAAGVDPGSRSVRLLLAAAHAAIGVPRHLSIHVGGFVLSDRPLSEIVPIENGRMPERTVIQWNKDDVDAMGMFKLDLLGLGMLTMLHKAFDLVRLHRGLELGLETIPPDDPATYDMLRRGDSVGVFQIESRAQMNMLARLRPERFYDLVIEVAIVRPGPIQGKMVHPYLRRRRGEEPVEYPHPKLEAILSRTLGVPLFQEQVMRLAEAVGGYTPGQADQLRRDMAAWNSAGKMQRHRERLIAGMLQSGLSRDFAERVFQQIEGFGSYGFPESHAAAFAHLAYVSAYLKRHFPAEFACALLNSQPMGFYSPAVIVNDFKRHGGVVRPVCAQRSTWDSHLEDGGALRLGLRQVRGLGEELGRAIERAAPFSSVEDLASRAGASGRVLTALAAAGALRALSPRRREAIWKASAAARSPGPLFDGIELGEPTPALPALGDAERLALDGRYSGTFPGMHPMELCRADLRERGVLSARELRAAQPGRHATVAGLVIARQRPGSARGAVFVTLEDETGQVDISLSAKTFERFQSVVRLSGALVARGKVMADGLARSISVRSVAPLGQTNVEVAARDFR